MKKNLFLLLLIIATSCGKTKESIQEDLVIMAMTDGQWTITKFLLDGSNITSSFAPYKFKYYSNKKVDAIKNGTLEQTGDWDGNASAMTTFANFAGATAPIGLINGTWLIQSNTWTYVIATQSGPGGEKTMRLDKL